jgi:hypothetical protein
MNDDVSNNLAADDDQSISSLMYKHITPRLQLQMLLSNKVTGSVRGQYRHEVQPTEMYRDFLESKGLTNLGYNDAISRFWIRSSVDFKILHAEFHIFGRKAQPVGITFSCLDKNVPFDGPFCRIFPDAPRNVLTCVSALIIDIVSNSQLLCTVLLYCCTVLKFELITS